jgi:predicted negative regulator of RcsB-dependent stress response
LRPLFVEGEFEFQRDIEYLILARVLVAQKRTEEALALADRIYRTAHDAEKGRMELEGLVLLALAASTQDEREQALALDLIA